MANYDQQPTRYGTASVGREAAGIDQGLRSYMLSVYNYMALGLAVTAIFALGTFQLAFSTEPTQYQITQSLYLTNIGYTLFASGLQWVLMLAPLGIVFFLGFRIQKMSLGAVQMTFWAFAALFGISLSTIFATYTSTSIVQVFLITAVTFGAMSLWGYTTKRDLTGMGNFLIMGVIGIFIAMIVNLFLASSALGFAISILGVLIFTGLTAYDTQKIKEMYYVGDDGTVAGKKAVMGALTLYIDFIMIFQFLLALLGGNRE